jgi:transcriptional regulator with XRE-family HTH domain
VVVATRQRMRYTLGMGQLTEAIVAAVKASDRTPYAIAKGAGVARSQLSRLLSGERGLTTDSVERLAKFLDLQITIKPRNKHSKGK